MYNMCIRAELICRLVKYNTYIRSVCLKFNYIGNCHRGDLTDVVTIVWCTVGVALSAYNVGVVDV